MNEPTLKEKESAIRSLEKNLLMSKPEAFELMKDILFAQAYKHTLEKSRSIEVSLLELGAQLLMELMRGTSYTLAKEGLAKKDIEFLIFGIIQAMRKDVKKQIQEPISMGVFKNWKGKINDPK